MATLTAMAAVAAVLVLLLAAILVTGTSLDAYLLLRLRHPDDPGEAWGPLWFQEGIRDITALGSNTILGSVVVAAALLFVLHGKARRAGFIMLSIAAALVSVNLLKAAFGRDRPDLLAELPVLSASFPSSHAMMSVVVYLTLALTLAEAAPRPAIRRAVVALALMIAALTGASRVYLGVHWPSDVLAGWALGLAWALLTVRLMQALAASGHAEPMHRTP